jgi:pimeloyl-ACP methyl ester carboxylesterase
VNGARLVYRCAGDGPIAVVVEQWLVVEGFTNPPEVSNFMGWQDVVDGISGHVRVCVYNRRGVGGSDQPRDTATLRTTQDQVDDLVGLIEELDLPTPLILVGHSVAGFNIRLFADQHPDLLAGAVFVDASHPDQLWRLPGGALSAGPPEWLDIGTSSVQVGDKGDMGDKRLVVITGGATYRGEEKVIWLDLQSDHASLSSNSQHIVLEGTGHTVMGSRPDAIVDAVMWIVDQLS